MLVILYYLYTECEVFYSAYPAVSINASHNLVAYVGDDLSIDCVVAALTHSKSSFLKWHKNGLKIDLENSSPPTKRVCYSKSPFDKVSCRQVITLIIRNLAVKDSGHYSCVAEVPNNFIKTDTILITVTEPVKQALANLTKIIIPVSVVIITLALSVAVGTYLCRKAKLRRASKLYQKRPLPKKG